MSDLKPCPFCGSSDIRLYSAGNSSRIYCDGCGAKSGIGTDDEVIAAWNRRAEPMPAQQWQPIETAPRNGIWFLAVDSTGRRRMVRWADKFDRLPINDEEGMWNTQPTHWMPLPKPPEGV